jgi:hypothetical protein
MNLIYTGNLPLWKNIITVFPFKSLGNCHGENGHLLLREKPSRQMISVVVFSNELTHPLSLLEGEG